MKIEVLYVLGCPNYVPTMEVLREILTLLGREDQVQEVEIRTQAQADASRFVGSPSIRINGSDIETWARTSKGFGLSCRTYVDGAHYSGVPSREMLRRAIREAVRESS